MDAVAFGKRVRALRHSRGLTQEQLAQLMGQSDGGVSHIEIGRRVPSMETLDALALALDAVSVVDLYDKRAPTADLMPTLAEMELTDLALLTRIARALPDVDPTVKAAHADALETLARAGKRS